MDCYTSGGASVHKKLLTEQLCQHGMLMIQQQGVLNLQIERGIEFNNAPEIQLLDQ